MLSAVVIIVVFLIVVTWHEFGHFIMAKLSSVLVNEFSIGMGPKIFSKKKNETLYSIRALPLGGFVSLDGEEEMSKNVRSFHNAPLYKRALIIVSGALMNFLLGFLVLLLLVGVRGKEVPTIAQFTDRSPAYTAGLEIGDRILKLNGHEIDTWQEVLEHMARNHGETVNVTVQRLQDKKNISVKPNKSEGRYVIGIYPAMERASVAELFSTASSTFAAMFMSLLEFLRMAIRGKVSMGDVSGPIGVATVLAEAAHRGLIDILFWLAYININLGVINLLPIPALDGGKLLFIAAEAISGKKIPVEKEASIHFIGFILLIGVMLMATYQDILKLLR